MMMMMNLNGRRLFLVVLVVLVTIHLPVAIATSTLEGACSAENTECANPEVTTVEENVTENVQEFADEQVTEPSLAESTTAMDEPDEQGIVEKEEEEDEKEAVEEGVAAAAAVDNDKDEPVVEEADTEVQVESEPEAEEQVETTEAEETEPADEPETVEEEEPVVNEEPVVEEKDADTEEQVEPTEEHEEQVEPEQAEEPEPVMFVEQEPVAASDENTNTATATTTTTSTETSPTTPDYGSAAADMTTSEDVNMDNNPKCPINRNSLMKCAVAHFDVNQDGKLDKMELKAVMNKKLPWLARNVLTLLGSVDKIIKKCDVDDDGMISMDYDMSHNQATCLSTCWMRRVLKGAFFSDCNL